VGVTPLSAGVLSVTNCGTGCLGMHADEEAFSRLPGAVELCDLHGIFSSSASLHRLAGKQPEGNSGKTSPSCSPRSSAGIDEAMAKAAAGSKIKDVRAACLTSTVRQYHVPGFFAPRTGRGRREFVVVSVRDSTKSSTREELTATQSESDRFLPNLMSYSD